MKIITVPSPSLRQPSLEVKDFSPLRSLVKDMQMAMLREKGVGLAAPQIGCNIQLFIINPELVGGTTLPGAYANPKLKYIGGKRLGYEGCLSIPGKTFLVQRYEKVDIIAQDIGGEIFELQLSGFAAKAIQHEFDHLQGFLIDSVGVELK